jgi:hypothetical protein
VDHGLSFRLLAENALKRELRTLKSSVLKAAEVSENFACHSDFRWLF